MLKAVHTRLLPPHSMYEPRRKRTLTSLHLNQDIKFVGFSDTTSFGCDALESPQLHLSGVWPKTYTFNQARRKHHTDVN